ncbi:glycerol-3-phosphate 1-O-acyltransferase PlsY [Ruminococcus sp. FC2018]|uniref:glycerol-3-phosphate 1-O-acyltransferase PlsY n=1 Tax=Ruminococcus sp. FC2018 TaxID=1410617 RepID=UPI000560D596|nr:glycerol-3-phosphate 1-O-acyltransferase PlsY [Ruminococcus sp. FC2018]
MSYLAIAFTVVFSYLFGSLNSAILVCRIMKHKDIREYGSKNAGLTNVYRVFGKGPALATLIFDLIKGVVAVVVCRIVVTDLMNVTFFGDNKFIGYLAGLIVMIGHIFPVFYGFHGGKGVLLAATTLLTIDPLTCALSVGTFIFLVVVTKYVSVGSIAAAISYPIFTFVVQSFIFPYPQGVIPNTIVAALIGIIIVYMHKPNIIRLMNGTENKFGSKKKSSESSTKDN